MSVALTVIRAPAADAEVAADRLCAAGAWAVEERPRGAGDEVELWAVLGDDPATIAARLGPLPRAWTWRLEHVDDVPRDFWRGFAAPVRIATDLVLRPAWVAPLGEPGVTEVTIEPGAAFGLGDHPTTRLVAAAVWRSVRPGDRVLDVGCGTGVLAIVALRGGAVAATAIDIAEPAIGVTLANAAANQVLDRIDVSTTSLGDVPGEFNLVVANVLAPVLVDLAAELRRVTSACGRLVVSGVLAGAHGHVREALEPMVVGATTALDGWAAIELRHPA